MDDCERETGTTYIMSKEEFVERAVKDLAARKQARIARQKASEEEIMSYNKTVMTKYIRRKIQQ